MASEGDCQCSAPCHVLKDSFFHDGAVHEWKQDDSDDDASRAGARTPSLLRSWDVNIDGPPDLQHVSPDRSRDDRISLEYEMLWEIFCQKTIAC